MKLTPKQLAAVVKAGLIVTNADGTAKEEEYRIIINEMNSFNITQEQGKALIEVAEAMSVEDMVAELKGLSEQDKKYVCGYLVAIVAVDGDIHDNEAEAWQAMCSLCEFPDVKASEALEYWKNN
ncbi:MAG: TerB family tellurite resistance protein [Bacteroidales bacterium]|nr:TerB family tellurite resistance protein [Bacteroidales bacterium]